MTDTGEEIAEESPLYSLYKELTGGVNILRVLGQFMNRRILVE